MKIESTILILSACYLLMLLVVVVAKKIAPVTSLDDKELRQSNIDVLSYLHMILMSLMMAASCTIKPLPYFVSDFPDTISFGQLAAFLLTFGAISFIPWKSLNHTSRYSSQLPIGPIVRYVLVRVVFLVMYEWFFRGLLLMSVSLYVGVNWAIAINVLLYTFLHIHKGKKEMLGCIPFGILLCVFTVWWQSIWPAIIFHLQMAAVNEWPLLQKFTLTKKQNAI